MATLKFIPVALSVFIFALPAVAQKAEASFTCPVTQPTSFVSPPGFPSLASTGFPYGNARLWVHVSTSPWSGLPLWDIGYRQKIVWFTEDYTWAPDKKAPPLSVTGRRLDASAPPL